MNVHVMCLCKPKLLIGSFWRNVHLYRHHLKVRTEPQSAGCENYLIGIAFQLLTKLILQLYNFILGSCLFHVYQCDRNISSNHHHYCATTVIHTYKNKRKGCGTHFSHPIIWLYWVLFRSTSKWMILSFWNSSFKLKVQNFSLQNLMLQPTTKSWRSVQRCTSVYGIHLSPKQTPTLYPGTCSTKKNY